jgi:peptidyl-prolyl cis-trans isomerase SurA
MPNFAVASCSRPHRFALLAATLLVLVPLLCTPALARKHLQPIVPPTTPITTGGTPEATIVAIVNGDVISASDVDARAMLFALSTGLPMTPEVINHLKPQVTRQLIDEKLRLQQIQRDKIVVSDAEIAAAIGDIESRNRMKPGALAAKLEAAGIPVRTLIDQLRVQIGWTRVLRQALGDRARVTMADVEAQKAITKAQSGQPEYNIAEIFIPVDDPAHAQEAQSFADTVIKQLHAGAPFSVVAAQFSQSQSALQGGDVGWRQPGDLEPAVAKIVTQMPVGAVSNPIEVPGGFMIVSLRAKRTVGNDLQPVITMRQVFLPFATALDPAAPTEQQKQTLLKAKQLSDTANSCDAIDAANKAAGSVRPSDPGEVKVADVSPPAFQKLLETIPLEKASQPLVSQDGIIVLAVCSRGEKNLATETDEQIAEQLVNERADLVSRQIERDLHRRAVIDMKAGA